MWCFLYADNTGVDYWVILKDPLGLKYMWYMTRIVSRDTEAMSRHAIYDVNVHNNSKIGQVYVSHSVKHQLRNGRRG